MPALFTDMSGAVSLQPHPGMARILRPCGEACDKIPQKDDVVSAMQTSPLSDIPGDSPDYCNIHRLVWHLITYSHLYNG